RLRDGILAGERGRGHDRRRIAGLADLLAQPRGLGRAGVLALERVDVREAGPGEDALGRHVPEAAHEELQELHLVRVARRERGVPALGWKRPEASGGGRPGLANEDRLAE